MAGSSDSNEGNPTKKMSGDDHLIPLPRQAVQILRNLYALTGSTGKIFAGKGKDGFMSGNTINAALRNMGWSTSEEITCHGFRATARTLIVEKLRFQKDDVERQLHHTIKQNNGSAYDRAEMYMKSKGIHAGMGRFP